MPIENIFFNSFIKIGIIICILLFVFAFITYKFVVIPGEQALIPVKKQSEQLKDLAKQLQNHVRVISEDIGERHYELPDAIDKAVNYIKQEFRNAGFDPELQVFGNQAFCNVITEITGTDKKNEIIVIGAHYDSVWLSPGANDNASGVAGLLEIARTLASNNYLKTIRFVAFANEEHPFSGTENMGSRVYAQSLADKNENIVAMFSLEMLGFYSDKAGSQKYPAGAGWFYPDTANFIAFISNLYSRSLLVNAINNYNDVSVSAQGLAAPEFLVPDIRRSDHASFWEVGYPAVMITDTANFRNINYHTVGDRIETLDFYRMAGVVSGLSKMIKNLANTN
jgi:Zn-dependent M28 family amino/carboxypeptidase